jgi:hypothetical protein
VEILQIYLPSKHLFGGDALCAQSNFTSNLNITHFAEDVIELPSEQLLLVPMVSEGASRSIWLEQEAPDLVKIWNDPHNASVPTHLQSMSSGSLSR